MTWIQSNWTGIALCLLIAIPAWTLGQFLPVVGGPVFSILIGMLVTTFLRDKARLKAGIAFTSKKILQVAVVLLGFGMNLSIVAKIGAQSLPIILSTISISLLIAFLLFKLVKIPNKIAVLVGVGSSICGGSAIAATAPVIEANDEEIAQSIAVIFIFNVIAALIFPTMGGMLGLSDFGFGLFAGTAVNDTSSVTAAASAWDAIHHANTLSTATVVKLTRTLAIIPITLALAFYRTEKEKGSGGTKVNLKHVFPSFILYFILASFITTVCLAFNVPDSFFDLFKMLSKFLIVMAMAAIGLNTNIMKLIRTGRKPIMVGLSCWIGIAVVSLLMQRLLGIW